MNAKIKITREEKRDNVLTHGTGTDLGAKSPVTSVDVLPTYVEYYTYITTPDITYIAHEPYVFLGVFVFTPSHLQPYLT